MERFVGIDEAAKALGVSVSTLRRWEANGRMAPEHTGGHRRYGRARLRPEMFHAADAPRRTVAYAGGSSQDQKAADLGFGMNYRNKGLKRLLVSILDGKVGRLVVTHKDRLLRLGAGLVFAIPEARNVEVAILSARRSWLPIAGFLRARCALAAAW